MHKGAALHALNRPEDALAACDEVVRRFGESESPVLLESVAHALMNTGTVLHALNRPEAAVAAYDEVVRRFEESETTVLLETVARAFVHKGAALGLLSRPEDALTASDEVVRRFGEGETPVFLEEVANALVNRGAALDALNRPEDALAAYDEVIRRFGDREAPALSMSVGVALLGTADIEVKELQYEKAAETATRVIERQKEVPAQRFQGHALRAKAILARGGDRPACELDVAAVLALLPELGPISRDAVDVLMHFSVALGPQRMRELIQASPSPHLLLPLTTALERELGLEPRVAREVDEVAQDVQQTLAELRANRTSQGPPPAIAISTARTRSSRP
ncbi:MAG: tetratricopeptide repeat protein [Acidobacteria bacterium]|nr:tetratricopeptide repeat protein [Acidobacteriota bacterium]